MDVHPLQFLKALIPSVTKIKTANQLLFLVVVAATAPLLYLLSVNRLDSLFGIGALVLVALFGFGIVVALTTFSTLKGQTKAYLLFYSQLLYTLSSLTVFILFLVFGQPTLTSIDIYLKKAGTALQMPFTLQYSIEEGGPQSVKGESGHALIRRFPAGDKRLNVESIACPGFAPKEHGPYSIEKHRVNIEMVEVNDRPPSTNRPNPLGHLPTVEQRRKAGQFKGHEVMLVYRNDTPDDLSLLLYNCDNADADPHDVKAQMKAWIKRPMPAGEKERPFSKFPDGTGWYELWVTTSDDRHHFLCTRNLYETKNPTLAIKYYSNGDKSEIRMSADTHVYVAEWGESQEATASDEETH